MRIPRSLYFWRYRAREPPSAESRNAPRTSEIHSLPTHLSQNIDAPEQDSTGRLSIGRAQDDPARQLAHQWVIIEHSNLVTTHDPHRSAAQPCTHPSRRTSSDLSEHHTLLTVPRHSPVPMTASQDSLLSQRLTPSPRQHSPQPQDESLGTHCTRSIHDSRNVAVDGNMNTVTYSNIVFNGSSYFMEKFLEKTILGAAFDSSARNPPPRCHPGTRLAILERCIDFIASCTGRKKVRWVVGAAGVGKSAIMQSVAESDLPPVTCRASIFFFVNERSDGTKAIVTLAYQFAAKNEQYRQFIEREITRDPSLLDSSMSVQFNKFVIEPFIHHPQLNSAGRILIIIDGLDECDKSRTQRELLHLISDLCLTYPSSPIVWLIASRPEPHITSFFSQACIEGVYEKEEILVDSDEARADVERFLRTELGNIQHEFSLSPRMQWPPEQDFWKLATASGGLFVYAYTATKYIGDPDIGDPALQLKDVLQVIRSPLNAPHGHPLSPLDALYSRILCKVPVKVRKNARKLLLALIEGWQHFFEREGRSFIVLCNWLGMSCDEAYAAIRHLSSVLDVPGRDTAHKKELRYLHKSFIDYISDFSRSGFSCNIKREARRLYVQCTLRILEQAPDGIDVGDLDYRVRGALIIGNLARGPGTGNNILLSWPTDDESGADDNKTRLFIYKMALASVVDGIRRRIKAFCTVFCIRLLVIRFESIFELGVENLHEVVFDKHHRHEFRERSLLQQVPVKILNFSSIMWQIHLHFRCPATSLCDPWNPLCPHRRKGQWEEDKDQVWSTELTVGPVSAGPCDFCCQRLERHLERRKTSCPDHPVSVLFTSAGVGLVEFQFDSLGDGMSEWTYWFWHAFSEEERECLGSTV